MARVRAPLLSSSRLVLTIRLRTRSNRVAPAAFDGGLFQAL